MSDETFDSLEVRYLFPTPVMIATVAGWRQLNPALKESIEKRRAGSEGMSRSNILGWHSDTDMLSWGGEAARTLALETLQLCGGRIDDLGRKDGAPRFQFTIEMWANVSPPGASNQYHTHPGCLWSGVYYVDDGGDETAALVLQDPNFPLNRMYAPDLQFVGRKGERFPTIEAFAPTPGRLIMFPSWLSHAVRPYTGDRERISIAMNLMVAPAT